MQRRKKREKSPIFRQRFLPTRAYGACAFEPYDVEPKVIAAMYEYARTDVCLPLSMPLSL